MALGIVARCDDISSWSLSRDGCEEASSEVQRLIDEDTAAVDMGLYRPLHPCLCTKFPLRARSRHEASVRGIASWTQETTAVDYGVAAHQTTTSTSLLVSSAREHTTAGGGEEQ